MVTSKILHTVRFVLEELAIQKPFQSPTIQKSLNLLIYYSFFFNTHDPTTLNRQGNDVGTQYRSGIYFTEIEQKTVTLQIIKKLEFEKIFDNPILTEVKEATPFYKAEIEHLNYFNENPDQPYCNYLIDPKITKLKKYFSKYISE